MGSAEGGVMSFARSKAKIYADDEVKVRFGADIATLVAGVDANGQTTPGVVTGGPADKAGIGLNLLNLLPHAVRRRQASERRPSLAAG